MHRSRDGPAVIGSNAPLVRALSSGVSPAGVRFSRRRLRIVGPSQWDDIHSSRVRPFERHEDVHVDAAERAVFMTLLVSPTSIQGVLAALPLIQPPGPRRAARINQSPSVRHQPKAPTRVKRTPIGPNITSAAAKAISTLPAAEVDPLSSATASRLELRILEIAPRHRRRRRRQHPSFGSFSDCTPPLRRNIRVGQSPTID